MQTPTGRPRSADPIPRPRPHGPADLGILADDLDYLAGMTPGSPVPAPRTGTRSGAQVSETYAFSNGDLELADHDTYDGYDDYDGEYETVEDALAEAAAPAGPIFVDASGRRRKLARRASLAAVAVVAGYAGLLAVSFAGGPIPPKALLPVPGIPAEKAPASSTSVAQNGAPAGKTGGTDHPGAVHPTGTASEHRTEPKTGTTSGAPGQGTPSGQQSSSSALPTTPTPTGSAPATTATTHGNPTPPGRTHHKSPSPS